MSKEELERARLAVEQTGDGEYALEWIAQYSDDPDAKALANQVFDQRERE